ncbi:hypothetical protein Q3G72_019219 [Acer saccharum]|nr:hypothetical protein Q3G72_019219 [Acer saccharum]
MDSGGRITEAGGMKEIYRNKKPISVLGLREDSRIQDPTLVEEETSDSEADMEEIFQATIAAELKERLEAEEIPSSDNSTLKEDMVRMTVEEERRRAAVSLANSGGVNGHPGNVSVAVEKSLFRRPLVDNSSAVRISNCSTQSFNKKGDGNSSAVTKHRMRTRNSKLVEEVVKVLETGSTIGFDFSGIEEEVSEVIARREEEDNDKFEDLNGQ